MPRHAPEPLPHDPWADHYESVMEQSFGALYARMTSYTMAEVDRLIGPEATVLDLGAGTGRMVIPLARTGRTVVAVERSGGMLEALETRLRALDPTEAVRVRVHRGDLRDAAVAAPADLVLCVFTVIAYCTTEEALSGAFTTASRALSGGGAFLLDVPDDAVFTSLEVETGDLIRDVAFTERSPGRYEYREHTVVRTPDGPVEYSDGFELRRWSVDEVERLLLRAGFTSIEDVTDRFPGLGARYLVARRPGVSSTGG